MSGAQVRIPLDSSVVRVPVGQVYVIPERCKGCRFCIEFCPEQVLAESEGMNAKGYHYPVVAAGKEARLRQLPLLQARLPGVRHLHGGGVMAVAAAERACSPASTS